MRKVLVTGSQGFVGTHLQRELLREGVTVIGFDISDGDIATCRNWGEDVEHVPHLAARTFIPDCWEHPFEFYRVNMLGTINALEFCRQRNIGFTYGNVYLALRLYQTKQMKMIVLNDSMLTGVGIWKC